MANTRRYALVLLSLFAGCARMLGHDPAQDLMNHPTPSDVHDRVEDCARIATLLTTRMAVRDDKVAAVEAPFEQAKAKAKAEQDIAGLQARQVELDCASLPPQALAPAPPTHPAGPAVAPSGPPGAAETDAGFDRCFKRCRAYTERTKEQCFDVCNVR
jgi:hypothetical protein